MKSTIICLMWMLAWSAPSLAQEIQGHNPPRYEEVLKKFKKHKISLILICPQYVSGKGNPFDSRAKDRISTDGFGRLLQDDAVAFTRSMFNGEAGQPELTGGVYLDVYFLFSDSPFEKTDKLVCYLTENNISIEYGNGPKGYVWIGLPKECFRLVKSNFSDVVYTTK